MSTVEVRSNRMELLAMIWFYCCVVLKTSSATDTMFPNQPLKDGDTLVSEAEIFELAFFGLGNSTSRYLGIRYKHVPDSNIVWVANREVPLVDRTGVLKINDHGTLQLLNISNTSIWLSQSSKTTSKNPVAQLLDSGNLVIRDDISGDMIWQSFDHPGDTWLPGMKIGVDRVMGTKRRLTSWKTSDDPSSGSYSRVGYWNGLGFTGLHGLERNIFYAFDFVSTDEENYYNFTLLDSSYLTRVRLDQQGNILQFVWDKTDEKWRVYMELFVDACDRYAICGSYGSCNINNVPACVCLQGFEPKLPMEWSLADWSNGCKRRISATDENGENFRKFTNLKLPDSSGQVSCLTSETLRKEMFQGKYLHKNVQHQQLNSKKKKSNTNLKVTMSIVFAVVLLGFALIIYVYAWRRKKKSHVRANKNKKQDSDLPLFSLSKIIKATSNFSIHNKLGQGGFGAVYKGVLDEGGEIAVKRLSKTSKQGLDEFQNEVIQIFCRGYISPKYAANGLFSVKSDVFSFGVFVLEIVSGKKNRGFSHQDHHDNLLGHEDKPLELVDTALGDSWIVSEVLQSIHVGLSCVQQHADDRPIMSSVIHMPSGEGALPPPQPPGFFTQVPKPEVKSSLIMPEVLVSINEVTITQFDAR
ncbi:unnamed protein product [Lactuca virosa]|uniref:Bulb-type lectin domain-containing protein n=1 Tax=Lactuca virosa TaxID=75947 RepID=A0AAU9MUI4_9ASTR|nr:unnamed protein product [Lactuca virosa]